MKGFDDAGHGLGTRLSLDNLEVDMGVVIDPGPRHNSLIDEAFAFLIGSSVQRSL